MILGRELEPRDAPGIDVDDDAMQHRDDAVAGKRILPRTKRRVTDRRLDEIHLADEPLILLLGRDLPRVGRPEKDGPIAAHPTRVVGRVAEILDAVGRELLLLPARDIADPE